METQDANYDEEAIKCSKLVEEEEQSCFDYDDESSLKRNKKQR